jgi:hypothetical protein
VNDIISELLVKLLCELLFSPHLWAFAHSLFQ